MRRLLPPAASGGYFELGSCAASRRPRVVLIRIEGRLFDWRLAVPCRCQSLFSLKLARPPQASTFLWADMKLLMPVAVLIKGNLGSYLAKLAWALQWTS